jgi:hypothetical protein
MDLKLEMCVSENSYSESSNIVFRESILTNASKLKKREEARDDTLMSSSQTEFTSLSAPVSFISLSIK